MKSILHSYFETPNVAEGNVQYTFVIWPDYMREDSFVFQRLNDNQCDIPRDVSIRMKKLFGPKGGRWQTTTPWFISNHVYGLAFIFNDEEDAVLFKLTFI